MPLVIAVNFHHTDPCSGLSYLVVLGCSIDEDANEGVLVDVSYGGYVGGRR